MRFVSVSGVFRGWYFKHGGYFSWSSLIRSICGRNNHCNAKHSSVHRIQHHKRDEVLLERTSKLRNGSNLSATRIFIGASLVMVCCGGRSHDEIGESAICIMYICPSGQKFIALKTLPQRLQAETSLPRAGVLVRSCTSIPSYK